MDSSIVGDRRQLDAILASTPFAVVRRGRDEVRSIAGADTDRGILQLWGAVPRDAEIRVLADDPAAHATVIRRTCDEAVVGAGGADAVLVFDSLARCTRSPEGASSSMDGSARDIVGIRGLGAFARTDGPTGLHEDSVVALAFG